MDESSLIDSNVIHTWPKLAMLILLLLAAFAIARIALRSRRRARGVEASTPHRVRYFGELGWLAAPAIAVATFAGISTLEDSADWNADMFRSKLGLLGVNNESHAPAVTMDTHQVGTDERTSSLTAERSIQRPDWLDQVRTGDGTSERIVIASRQYTTREEAETELAASATALLIQDLQQLRPEMTRPSSWNPPREAIKQHMVKQQYLEAVDHDFGSFVHPMYRVWWQIELSPEVRTEFLPEWRRGLTVNRIHRVGVVASTLVLAASLLAMYRRLDVLTRGAWRTRLRLLTGSVATAWLFTASRFL